MNISIQCTDGTNSEVIIPDDENINICNGEKYYQSPNSDNPDGRCIDILDCGGMVIDQDKPLMSDRTRHRDE